MSPQYSISRRMFYSTVNRLLRKGNNGDIVIALRSIAYLLIPGEHEPPIFLTRIVGCPATRWNCARRAQRRIAGEFAGTGAAYGRAAAGMRGASGCAGRTRSRSRAASRFAACSPARAGASHAGALYDRGLCERAGLVDSRTQSDAGCDERNGQWARLDASPSHAAETAVRAGMSRYRPAR